MSSRALRKAQREKEEQERLHALEQSDGEADEQHGANVAPKKSAFAMLEGFDDGEDSDEHEDGGIDQPIQTTTTQEAQPPTSTKSKKKKKKKSKAVKAAADDIDEIDAALKELAMSNNSRSTGETTGGSDPLYDEACHLLAVDRSFLHAQNEMRRLFGRAAVEQENEEPDHNAQAGGNRRQQRRGQQAGLAQALRGQRGDGRASGMASISLRRNIFIQGKEEWPAATSGGLGMEIVDKAPNGTIEYRYVHNRIYQSVQSQFNTCVASMDPDRLVLLLQHNPYHISTLLQVSEIAKNDRDHATSGDLLERALFSMGRAVHSTFAKSLSEGKARLDFRRPENREFWLASWRYMQNLSMRGTWRTVYEWARLLLALAPEDDPYALWLILDQYALRSKQDLDYINLSRNALFKHVHEGMPNVLISQGLAEFRSGNKSKGQQTLFSAVSQYPWFVARLMHELDLDAPPAIWGKEPRTEKEQLYAELYAVRAKDIWNTPENSALLLEIASAVPSEAKAAPANDEEIELNEARHTILSDTPALIAMLPKKYTSQYTSVSDPLPPPDSIVSHAATTTTTTRSADDDVRDAAEEEHEEFHGLNNFLQYLLPGLMRRESNGAGNEDPLLDDEERRILEGNGVSESELQWLFTRLRHLRNRGLALAGEALDNGSAHQSENDHHQPHIEEVSDHGD